MRILTMKLNEDESDELDMNLKVLLIIVMMMITLQKINVILENI